MIVETAIVDFFKKPKVSLLCSKPTAYFYFKIKRTKVKLQRTKEARIYITIFINAASPNCVCTKL